MSAPRVTAVVVSYRSRDTIGASLAAAREAAERGLLDCVVVDNGGDDTADLVERDHPWVRVVRNRENVGFGSACNVGFRGVRSDYVLLLNPDAVLPADALARLVAFLDDHPKAGLVAPAIREPDGALQHAGGLPSPLRVVQAAAGADAALGRCAIEPGAAPFRTDWLCGAILLVRRSLLEDLGGFDERFFLYFEETDLCRRALRAGWEIWAVGEATGFHQNAASTDALAATMHDGCIAEHYYQSRFYYLVKHFGWPRAALAELGELCVMALRSGWRALRRRAGSPLAERMRAPILALPAERAR